MKRITSIITKNKFIVITLFFILIISGCKTITKEIPVDEYAAYLKPDIEANEAFHVLIISNRYDFSQMKYQDKIKRSDDADGDNVISSKLKEYDKIDEISEGVLTVWLYPETGKIMKIRPKTLASIAEINSLIVEDLKRWNFELKEQKKSDKKDDKIEPNTFDIKYRVVLRKLQSDEDIMKEVQEKKKKEEEKKQQKGND
jgi:hypothetical protein